MDIATAIQKLRTIGFDEYSSHMGHTPGTALSIDDVRGVVHDALACLSVINRAANGDVPSKVVGVRPSPAVLSDAAYPVALLVSGGLLMLSRIRQSATGQSLAGFEDALIKATTVSSYAWAQVLAGDMDDICDGLEESLGAPLNV